LSLDVCYKPAKDITPEKLAEKKSVMENFDLTVSQLTIS
jgi:hypothetical protein